MDMCSAVKTEVLRPDHEVWKAKVLHEHFEACLDGASGGFRFRSWTTSGLSTTLRLEDHRLLTFVRFVTSINVNQLCKRLRFMSEAIYVPHLAVEQKRGTECTK